jgi:zinc protease
MMTAPFRSVSPRLRVRRVEGAALVAIRVLAAGGERRESIPGQALVTGRMLAEGTLRRDFERISADAEGLGMIVGSFGGFEAHGIAVDALAADWEQAIDWVVELLFEPSFPEQRLRWLARQAAAELEAQNDEADTLTGRAHLEQLWAPHPRSRPLQGDAQSLARIGPDDCRAFHAAALANPLLVSVAGRIDEEAVRAALERRFAGTVEAQADDPRPQPVVPGTLRRFHPEGEVPADSREVPADSSATMETRREIRTRARDQAHLFLGHLTIPRSHADYAALEVAGVLLGAGAGLTGRIPQRIREREGLAYTAAADTVTGASLDPGRLAIYVGTSPATVAQAEASARDELARFLAEPISPAELADAKSYLIGREPFRRETGRQWADLLAASELLKLPLDDPEWHAAKIAALGAADVEAAARRHLDPERLIATVGLPA